MRETVLSPAHRATTIGVVSLVLMVAFEAMAVATAMPVAARELDGLDRYAWAFTGFMAASLFATSVSGPLCDRIGPRWPMLTGVALFALGLLLSGSAVSMWPFVAGRAVQGLGVGVVIVAMYLLIADCYPDRLRPRIFAWVSAGWVLPSIIGPLVAGVITEHTSWRWVFWGLVPLVALPVVLLWKVLHSRNAQRQRSTGRVWWATMLVAGVVALQQGGVLAEGDQTLVALVVAIPGLVATGVSLRRLLPPGTLRLDRGLPSVVAMRGVVAGGFFGVEAFIPLMLVSHRDISTTLAGASLTGAALGWTFGSWVQGRTTETRERGRLVVIGAATVVAGCLLSLAGVVDDPGFSVPAWIVAVGWTVAGLGMGLVMSALSVLLMDLSPGDEQGVNAAALQTSDFLGGILTVGTAGVVYALLRHETSQTALFTATFAFPLLVATLAVVVATRVLPDATPVRT